MDVKVRFGEGKVVEAVFRDFDVRTDQPVEGGGGGTAPSPFDLFLASIATCAGYYVLNFCRARELPTDGIQLEMRTSRDRASHLIEHIDIEIMLPSTFPAKYEKAVVRAAELCSVKKHLENGIEIETMATRVCT